MFYGTVYKVTNKINGKIYIGQTINDIHLRLKQHFYEARCALDDCSRFHDDLRLYGSSSFEIEKVEDASTKEELDAKEQFYIREFNSCEMGYNSNYGVTNTYGSSSMTRDRVKKLFEIEGIDDISEIAKILETSEVAVIRSLENTGSVDLFTNLHGGDEIPTPEYFSDNYDEESDAGW